MKIKYTHEIKTGDKITDEEILKLIVKKRKIKNIKEFMNPSSPMSIGLMDFGYKKEIKKTVKILEEIKNKQQMIVVYTDYDADGITGGAILWETLYLLGFKVMPYVPHRKNEGYGFSNKGIDNVKKEFNPALIISVDHGISAREKIAYAKSLGIDVIVTDHHLKPDKLPDKALAIFHISELSGSGVAYFFAKEIFNAFKKYLPKNLQGKLEYNFQIDYLALAAIGTIADMVPLLGPSRSLVKYGLPAFKNIKRVGIRHILLEAGIIDKEISPYEVGFIIAPRINAVGRLEHALDALRLLCTNNEEKARQLATKVGLKNRERQDLVKQAVDEAKKMVESILTPEVNKFGGLPKIIILKSDHWHEGIIGLIASKIADKFFRPTIVMTKSDGIYKGSARSIPALSITDFLKKLHKYLIDVGGHKQAAGFTIEKNQVDNFIRTSEKEINKWLKNKDLVREISADIKIPISRVTMNLAKYIETLKPFGIGNLEPTFYSEGKIVGTKTFGKKNEHIKIYIKDTSSQQNSVELIYFNYSQLPDDINQIKLIYRLSVNNWNHKEKLNAIIQNLS